MSPSMLGKKVKAAILVEQKKPLVIGEIELPKKLEYGQVLVKIHYTGICGSQLNEIDGVKDAYGSNLWILPPSINLKPSFI